MRYHAFEFRTLRKAGAFVERFGVGWPRAYPFKPLGKARALGPQGVHAQIIHAVHVRGHAAIDEGEGLP